MPADHYLVSAARRLHKLRMDRPYVFGRDEKADIVIQDALISRRHAEVCCTTSGTWQVKDLGSRNGVLVNGAKIAGTAPLKDGDRLQVGGQVFRFHQLPPGGNPASLSEQAPQIADSETMGPEFKMEDIVTRGANFVGDVTAAAFFDLLQYFQSTGRTGRLDLVGGPNLAAVWFTDGNAVHAVLGAKSGMEALTQLAKGPPPRFAFHASAPPPDRKSLQGSLQGLLMEITRVLDEEKR
jgi:hypothetical protein